MKRKILMLMILIVLVTSSLVPLSYADSYYSFQYIDNGFTYILTSDEPFYVKGTDPMLFSRGTNVKLYENDNLLWTQTGTSHYIFSDYNSFISSHDIYYDDGTLFYSLPTLWSEGMAGAQQKLLNPILANLPIILGMLVLAIGFYKALKLLFRVLRAA